MEPTLGHFPARIREYSNFIWRPQNPQKMRLQCFFSSVRANMKLYHSECDYEQCQRLYMLESLKLLYGYLCCMFCSKSHTNLTLEECPCSLEMQSAAASHINVSSSDLKWKSSWWTARFSWQVASIRYESPHTYKISIINWSSTENTRKEITLDRSLHLSGMQKVLPGESIRKPLHL